LIEEYEKNNQLDKEVCYDENTPCVPNIDDKSNNKKIVSSTSNTTESLESAETKPQQLQIPFQELKNQAQNPIKSLDDTLDNTFLVSSNNSNENHEQNNGFGRFDDTDDTLHIMKVRIFR
jgi:hypothetical protein